MDIKIIVFGILLFNGKNFNGWQIKGSNGKAVLEIQEHKNYRKKSGEIKSRFIIR